MSVSQLVAQNAVRSLFAFVYSTQVDNHYLVGALFDNLSALFLLLGLATLFTPAPRESRFILIWYGVLLAVTGLTFYAPSIPTTRTNIVLPAACVIAAIGAATLIGRICDLFPNLTPAHSARPTSPRLYTAAPWALAAVAIVGVVGLNLNTFYRVMPERLPASQFALEMEVILSHPEATVIIAPDLASHVFEDTLQIYGVQADRVIQAFGPPLGLSVEQALTRARGHPAIVVSGVDQPLSVPGNRVALWDPSHTRYLVLAMVQSRSG
jgi:hypothetical protein